MSVLRVFVQDVRFAGREPARPLMSVSWWSDKFCLCLPANVKPAQGLDQHKRPDSLSKPLNLSTLPSPRVKGSRLPTAL